MGTEGHFWDKDLWNRYLTLWSSEGYNAIVWIGPNETGTGDLTGHHMLLRLEEFPEAREMPAEENEEIIGQMKWLLRWSKKLGMQNLLYTHFVWVTPAFAKAHGLDVPMPISQTVCKFHNEPYGGKVHPNIGVVNELTRAYTEAIYAEFPRVYEDLDGFYTPIGEALPGNRCKFYREAMVPGLKRSGRKPLVIAHQWQVPLEDYLENVAPEDVYDNTWLGFHGYNSEQISDAKPYPGVIEWSEQTGLPTVVAIYPANAIHFPFNSPRFACEIAREMKKVEGFAGFLYWEHSGRKLSPLFRKSLAYYAANDEAYSEEPWVDLLEEQFGDRAAAEHFLRAYDISGRIIPEMCALVYFGGDGMKRELRLPYHCLTGDYASGWMTSPARGRHLVPIRHYARFVAKDPERYKDNNGSDPNRYPYFQQVIWRSEGGSIFDIVPPAHMRKVRAMGEECLQEAEEAMKTVSADNEEAQAAYRFMKTFQLLSRYYERKVAAGTAALVYGFSGRAEDKVEAEQLADEALESYLEAGEYMHAEVDPLITKIKGHPLTEQGADLQGLMKLERQERDKLASIFRWAE
jgi:hypothetical protein